jgi:acyl-coenzyme A thioesterase PaaI-like protein
MPFLELPHTAGCLVCGRDNPHGLNLSSLVDPDTGIVSTTFTPAPHHIGFESIIHGGILATVADELMVWSAIWASGKACVAAELSLRFIQKAVIGQPLNCTAKITRQRSRLIETTAEIHDGALLICTAAGKYVPLGPGETRAFFKTFADEPDSRESAEMLRSKPSG